MLQVGLINLEDENLAGKVVDDTQSKLQVSQQIFLTSLIFFYAHS